MLDTSSIGAGTATAVILRLGAPKNLYGDAQGPGDSSPLLRSGSCGNESRAGRAAGPYKVFIRRGWPAAPWDAQNGGFLAITVVLGARQIELAESRRVGEDVDLDDLPARDREAHDR